MLYMTLLYVIGRLTWKTVRGGFRVTEHEFGVTV